MSFEPIDRDRAYEDAEFDDIYTDINEYPRELLLQNINSIEKQNNEIKKKVKEWELYLNRKVNELQNLEKFCNKTFREAILKVDHKDFQVLLSSISSLTIELEEITNDMWSINR